MLQNLLLNVNKETLKKSVHYFLGLDPLISGVLSVGMLYGRYTKSGVPPEQKWPLVTQHGLTELIYSALHFAAFFGTSALTARYMGPRLLKPLSAKMGESTAKDVIDLSNTLLSNFVGLITSVAAPSLASVFVVKQLKGNTSFGMAKTQQQTDVASPADGLKAAIPPVNHKLVRPVAVNLVSEASAFAANPRHTLVKPQALQIAIPTGTFRGRIEPHPGTSIEPQGKPPDYGPAAVGATGGLGGGYYGQGVPAHTAWRVGYGPGVGAQHTAQHAAMIPVGWR